MTSNRLAAAVLLLLLAPPARALDLRQDLKQLIHRGWILEDGAPQDIRALAQSADGYIWIGSADGLFRFDGVTFERIPALAQEYKRSGEIYSLLALPNGDVWVGYFWGGVALYHDGRLQDINYPTPTGSVNRFAQGVDGSIWVETDGRRGALQHYVNGKWEHSEDNWGLGIRHLYGLATTGDGTVWVCSNNSRSYLRPGTRKFATTSETLGTSGTVAEDGTALLWIMDGTGIYRLPASVDAAGAAKPLPTTANSFGTLWRQMMFDRQGALWAASKRHGADPHSQSEEPIVLAIGG